MFDCSKCGKKIRSETGYKSHYVAKHGGYVAWNIERRRIKREDEIKSVENRRLHSEQVKQQQERDAREQEWLNENHLVSGADLDAILSEVSDLCDWLQPYYTQNTSGSFTPTLDLLIKKTKEVK